ncbi:Isoleucyl-tRNA synthetase, mitochondrial, partial [Operophtera brumata]
VHYVPGWDCHGLPIELKALQKAKKTVKQNELTDPVHIRQIAREFALQTVENQKAAFKSWGIMADWDQSYLTLSKGYVQNQLRQFFNMYEKGLVFRALKPVYWSPSSNKPLSAIIWTTTPWTLVANRAICYNPQLKYSIVTLSNMGKELYLVGSGLIEGLEKTLGVEIQRHFEFDGHQLQGVTYTNKLVTGILPFLEADHVTEGKGTGLVHTAPAHGPDDFLVALKNNMHVECNVDESGCYANLDPALNGLPVLSEGQDTVISLLGTSVLHRGTYIHSYPLDWRTKKPVILRASRQWFIDTAALKERALSSARETAVLVYITTEGMGRIINNLCELIEKHGTDIWWTSQVESLLPADVINEHNLNTKEKLLDDCQSEVIRVRNILKYLLGVVSDVKKPLFAQKPVLNYFDAYMVKETEVFLAQINESYNNLRYNNVAQSILYFISNKVSGLYCHCIKDRLYCSQKESNDRISAQLVLHTILVSLFKALGPILPHLIEEAWLHHPLKEKPFYFTEDIPVLTSSSIDVSVMDAILDLKKDVCSLGKNENLKKLNAQIRLNSDLFLILEGLNSSDGVNDSVLCEILEVSSVSLEEVRNGGKWNVSLSQSKNSQCLRCRKYNAVQ